LAEESFLADDFLRQLMSVGEVDLLVAFRPYNNASTIGQTLQIVEESLRQNFVRERVVILTWTAGPETKTPQLFERRSERREPSHKGLTTLRTIHRISCEYDDRRRKVGAADIVAAADLLRARACAVISQQHELDAFLVANC